MSETPTTNEVVRILAICLGIPLIGWALIAAILFVARHYGKI